MNVHATIYEDSWPLFDQDAIPVLKGIGIQRTAQSDRTRKMDKSENHEHVKRMKKKY